MKNIKFINKETWNKISEDYKGIYEDYQEVAPELKGKKTLLANENGATVLLFEDIHFKIEK